MSTKPTVQQILTAELQPFRESHPLNSYQLKVMNDIIKCRTEEMGMNRRICDHCGHVDIHYDSCRSRFCPTCQNYSTEVWIESLEQSTLDVPWFHAVFTVPAVLNTTFLSHQKELYGILFKASSETVLELCADNKYLGATPAITAVLHTWGSNLSYHPHVHMAISGGGLTDDGKWKSSRKTFFLPVRVMSKIFRGKFMDYLKQAFPDLDKEILDKCREKEWVVYCKRPFGDKKGLLRYLGRYSHRVAITDSRLISYQNGMVKFSVRAYTDEDKDEEKGSPKCKYRSLTLTDEEFMRRFILHILPKGFRKIRHYGILAPRGKKERLELCRRLTDTPDPPPPKSTYERLSHMLGKDFDLCPQCRVGRMIYAPIQRE